MFSAKTIVLSGASSGIGAALTRALAADGHRLFVCARREKRLAEVTEGGKLADYTVADVAIESQVAAFIEHVREHAGAIDALICGAGAYGPIGRFDECDSEQWFATLRANLFGTYLLARHAVALMRPERRPRIITFGGGGAFQPLPRYSAYAVSKAGIVRLTETLAKELAPSNIAVNAVAPGFVATEIHDATLAAGPEASGPEFHAMTKKKLAGGAVPVAVPVACVRYLLSDEAAGLTGKTISAGFDPWGEPEFNARIDEINASDLYTMQRINLVHLKGEPLAGELERAAHRKQKG
jgi:3-oxoacyl-[acyl-carrier protein] reductase